MISEEFIKTELENLSSDIMKVMAEIEKRKADFEKQYTDKDELIPPVAAHRGLQRELNYIFGRMGQVVSYFISTRTSGIEL